jgi:outer membrane autotransporter protein
MNTIYRIVWNAAIGKWVVTSELATGRGEQGNARMPARALALVLSAVLASNASATTYNQVIDTDQTTTVNLQAGGGSALINAGIVVSPVSGNGIVGGVADIWSVTNNGTIDASVLGKGVELDGINLFGNGSAVINSGTIHSAQYGVVSGTNYFADIDAISITNLAGGTISGGSMGVFAWDGLEVENHGTIYGNTYGIYNVSTDKATGDLTKSITNDGTISGGTTAISLQGGTDVTYIQNINGGQILGGTSGNGIYASESALLNVANGTESVISGGAIGVNAPFFFTHIVLDNAGLIQGGVGVGAFLYDSSVVDNQEGATIVGAGGVLFGRSRGYSLTNAGTIKGIDTTLVEGSTSYTNLGAGAGVYLGGSHGAAIDNQATGLVEGGAFGIYQGALNGTSPGQTTITNAGTITGDTGIAAASGDIDIINTGTIEGTGGTAIAFDRNGTFGSTLTLGTGSLIKGSVIGGGGQNQLTFIGTGSENIGKFSNFQNLVMHGDSWTLAGTGQFTESADIQDGMLNINGTLTTPNTTVETDGSLAGYGAVNGDVINRGIIAPGEGVIGSTAFGNFTINGQYTSTGGTVRLNTVLNDGGTLANQFTDRLLITGDVTGTTVLDVHPQGVGTLTDKAANGIVDANEGISLVQVGGHSSTDAFVLKNGYVAAGPWQYTLHAFGPGETDSSQNLLTGGALNWDYRLGNAYVCETECAPDPIDSVIPSDPGRIAVVPQVPSYIAAPTALLVYGASMVDTLHQRLGEIRDEDSKPSDTLGGEVFARYIGAQYTYRTDLGFSDYGYNFDQQISALQLGGSIMGWAGDSSSLRTGWALDHGTTRVTPQAADGQSTAEYTANGVSAWMTWQQTDGFYVDAVMGGERFSGTVNTALRGSDVAKVAANSWTASIETGYPFALGSGWSAEPQAQLKYQSLTFRDIQDIDNLATHIAPIGQATARLGARVSKTDNIRFMPYLHADVMRSMGGRPQVNVTSETWNVSDTFAGGGLGTSYRVGAGATSQFTRNLAVYGEADYMTGADDHGLEGWFANLGLRWNF